MRLPWQRVRSIAAATAPQPAAEEEPEDPDLWVILAASRPGQLRCPARGPDGELCSFLIGHDTREGAVVIEHEWIRPEHAAVICTAWNINEAQYALNRLIGRLAVERGVASADLAEWSGWDEERVEDFARMFSEGAFS